MIRKFAGSFQLLSVGVYALMLVLKFISV